MQSTGLNTTMQTVDGATAMSHVHDIVALSFGNSSNTRLVELLPMHESGLISCRLQVVSLESKPQYTALSYVRGDDSDDRQILVDGKFFTVRQNL